MKMLKFECLLLLASLLTGCSSGYVRDVRVNEDEIYCGQIANVSELLDVYVTERDSNNKASAVVQNTPIVVDLKSDVDRTVHLLAEPINNDVTAIRSVLFTIVVLRNMAPCDSDNIKYSWLAIYSSINALVRHYGESNDVRD